MFKLETHMHTRYSSGCGHMEAAALVDGYLEAGYAAVAVTDHFSRATFRMKQLYALPATEQLEVYLEGFYRVREEAERCGLVVYRGAELNFDGSQNDYLLYNWPDELLLDAEQLFREGPVGFYARSRETDAIFLQAHPFRTNCVPVDPRFLDGIEICNTHPDHSNHNELACGFGASYGGILTSGSDCHEVHHLGRGGICAAWLPKTDADFAQLLRSGQFSLLGAENGQ